ncbi:MAG: TAXI family TRAP transporter solute-binding subunit [Pseudomonadota bacterium]|nr:TAXI family TRAP transporter solute-binding subunit [Pseudomonadota bacterium]
MRWLAAACALLVLQAFPVPAAPADRERLAIATASLTGVYYGAGNAICRLMDLAPARTRLPCRIEETAGSGDNLGRLVNSSLNLGIAQSDVVLNTPTAAAAGVRVIGGLYPEVFHVVVRDWLREEDNREPSGIVFNIGIPGSGQRATTEDFFRVVGFDTRRFKAVLELDPAEQADAFCRRRIDAFTYVAGIPNTAVAMAIERCGGRLRDFRRQTIGQYVRSNPATRFYRVRPNAYPSLDETYTTFASTALLLAAPSLSDRAVETLVLSLIEHAGRFRLMHPAFSEFSPQTLVTGVDPEMLHPVARHIYTQRSLLRGTGAK